MFTSETKDLNTKTFTKRIIFSSEKPCLRCHFRPKNVNFKTRDWFLIKKEGPGLRQHPFKHDLIPMTHLLVKKVHLRLINLYVESLLLLSMIEVKSRLATSVLVVVMTFMMDATKDSYHLQFLIDPNLRALGKM